MIDPLLLTFPPMTERDDPTVVLHYSALQTLLLTVDSMGKVFRLPFNDFSAQNPAN